MPDVSTDAAPQAPAEPGRPPAAGRSLRRRRLPLALAVVAGVLVVIVVAGVVWFVAGRDRARARSTDEAVETFRNANTAPSTDPVARRPAAGVYTATASGSESVGIAGLDESLGPEAPVTVTHGSGECFTYRADLNTHHWRSWTYCPTADGGSSLAGTASSTLRKFPGLDFGSVNTYTCDRPLPARWSAQAAGDRRDGTCTGTSDTIEGVTSDAGTVEVIEVGSYRVGATDVPAVHLRTTDTFGGAQTGTETAELWIATDTGLPLSITFDTQVKSDTPLGTADYVDRGRVDLTALTPTS